MVYHISSVLKTQVRITYPGVFVLASKVKLHQAKPAPKKAATAKKLVESTKKPVETKQNKSPEKTSLPKRAPSTIPRPSTPRAITPKPASSKPQPKPTATKPSPARAATPKPAVKSTASTRVNSPKSTEVTELNEKIKQLEKELTDLKAAPVEDRTEEISLLREQLAQVESTKSQLERTNSEAERKIQSLVDELMAKSQLESELEAAKIKLTELGTENTSTNASLQDYVQKYTNTLKQLEELQNLSTELEMMTVEKSKLDSHIENLETQLAEYKNKLSELESQRNENSAPPNQAELDHLNTELAKLKLANQNLKDDLEESHVAKNLIQEKLQFLQGELDSAHSNIDSLQNQFASTTSELESCKAELKDVATAREAAETKVEETNRFFEVVQNNYNSTLEYVATLQSKESELTQNLSNTTNELEVTKTVCEELRGYIVELENGLPAIRESGNEDQDELVAQLREENKTVKQTVQTLNAEYEDAIRKCENYEFQISTLQKQLNETEKTAQDGNTELSKEELEAAKSQIESLQSYVLELQTKLETSNSNDELLQDLEAKKNIIAAMSEQIELLQQRLESLQTERDSLSKSVEEYELALGAKDQKDPENTYQELEAELQTQMLENHNLQAKLATVEALCSQLKESLKDNVVQIEKSKIEYSTLQSDYNTVMSKQNEYYQHIEDLKDHIDELQNKLQQANNYIKLQEDNQQESDMDGEKLRSALVEKRNEMEDLRSSLMSLMDNMNGILEKCEEQAKALYVMYPDEDGMTQLVQDISCLLMLQEQMDELMVSFQWIKKSIDF
ncbi:hypothetical protein HK103_004011 [Boothiomyces macroporosus]|uniref:Uncharacterized protein n=1 Tax=Boothiomyces macroporosus TaxID=261099 RepID=A0AAD5UHD1_9FUNG|nr:hypothetical protein HK103_004011 [Boothiomyces macroporosus]